VRLARSTEQVYLRPAVRERHGLTLRSKLLVMFVLFALIPLIAIGALGYIESLRALEALVGSQTTLIAERIAGEVRDRRERLDANLALLAENAETERMLAVHSSGSAAVERTAIASARAYLMDVRTAMGSNVEWISIRDAAGTEVLRLPDSVETKAPAQDDRLMQVSRALPSGAGTVVVGMRLSALLPPEALEARFGRTGYLVVVDRVSGRVLYGAEHVDALSKAQSAPRSRLTTHSDATNAFVARYSEADSTRVATVAPLAHPEWTLVVAGTVDEFAAPFIRLRATTLGLIAVVGLVAALGFFIVLWRATASLRILTVAADEVGRGNFEPRLPETERDEVGRLTRAFGLMIGRVREMMAQVERGRQMAAVGEFANEIAHEIRNPLTSIKLNLQALERGARDDQIAASLVRPLEISLREVHRLDRVVHGVLRLGRGRSAERSAVALRQVVQRALDVARPQLEQRGIRVSMTDDATVDGVVADGPQLEAAVLNLLLNAAEATQPEGIVRVSIEHAECETARVRVRIRDGGPGVATELRERIFQPFFTTKPGGTGLGLALAQRTAEEHGGTLTLSGAASDERVSDTVGAEFVLELPSATPVAGGRST
jgi:signal transduction histidine kinase